MEVYICFLAHNTEHPVAYCLKIELGQLQRRSRKVFHARNMAMV